MDLRIPSIVISSYVIIIGYFFRLIALLRCVSGCTISTFPILDMDYNLQLQDIQYLRKENHLCICISITRNVPLNKKTWQREASAALMLPKIMLAVETVLVSFVSLTSIAIANSVHLIISTCIRGFNIKSGFILTWQLPAISLFLTIDDSHFFLGLGSSFIQSIYQGIDKDVEGRSVLSLDLNNILQPINTSFHVCNLHLDFGAMKINSSKLAVSFSGTQLQTNKNIDMIFYANDVSWKIYSYSLSSGIYLFIKSSASTASKSVEKRKIKLTCVLDKVVISSLNMFHMNVDRCRVVLDQP